jgi:CRP/FNR family transcriptional regulator, cyclic AMP receptor protein
LVRHVLHILGTLTDDDVDWLLSSGRRQSVAAGVSVIDEGRPVSALFIVLEGTLSARVAALGNQEVGRFECGAIAGEMSFVDGLPPSATVRADEDARVLAIPRDTLNARLQRDTAFAARFYKAIALLLSERLRTSHRQRAAGHAASLEEGIADGDELDPNNLDTLYLAGLRFERILHRLSDA